MKRTSKAPIAVVASNPLSSSAASSPSFTEQGPVNVAATTYLKPAKTNTVSQPQQLSAVMMPPTAVITNADTANTIASAAAVTIPTAATVLVSKKGFWSFSIRKFLWSAAILFIGWYLYTRRTQIMTWLFPEKKPSSSSSSSTSKRPFNKEAFTNGNPPTDSTSTHLGSQDIHLSDAELEDMRAKRLKNLHVHQNSEEKEENQTNNTSTGSPLQMNQVRVEKNQQQQQKAKQEEEQEEEEEEVQHTEQEKLNLLHELNLMVGDVDIFPTIPLFESAEDTVTFVVGNGPMMSHVVGDNRTNHMNDHFNQEKPNQRITEIVEDICSEDRPAATTSSSSFIQQQQQQQQQQQEQQQAIPIQSPDATMTSPLPPPVSLPKSAGFGKRSRRKADSSS